MIFETLISLTSLQNIEMFAQGYYQIKLTLQDSKIKQWFYTSEAESNRSRPQHNLKQPAHDGSTY
jgi:hypothetical protein